MKALKESVRVMLASSPPRAPWGLEAPRIKSQKTPVTWAGRLDWGPACSSPASVDENEHRRSPGLQAGRWWWCHRCPWAARVALGKHRSVLRRPCWVAGSQSPAHGSLEEGKRDGVGAGGPPHPLQHPPFAPASPAALLQRARSVLDCFGKRFSKSQ